mmetsp:Transcript_24599/g.62267  ORF Transcript_24599/g.62267 Transcript_24599/m.62267 type:complete len:273 (+) Transcript_24599:903-1721(+)
MPEVYIDAFLHPLYPPFHALLFLFHIWSEQITVVRPQVGIHGLHVFVCAQQYHIDGHICDPKWGVCGYPICIVSHFCKGLQQGDVPVILLLFGPLARIHVGSVFSRISIVHPLSDRHCLQRLVPRRIVIHPALPRVCDGHHPHLMGVSIPHKPRMIAVERRQNRGGNFDHSFAAFPLLLLHHFAHNRGNDGWLGDARRGQSPIFTRASPYFRPGVVAGLNRVKYDVRYHTILPLPSQQCSHLLPPSLSLPSCSPSERDEGRVPIPLEGVELF